MSVVDRYPVSPDLARLCESVEILAKDRFAIDGQVQSISPSIEASTGSRQVANSSTRSRRAEVRQLANLLYFRLYTRVEDWLALEPDLLARRDHIARLSRANCGRGTWEPGWTLGDGCGASSMAVEKDGVTFWVAPQDVRVSSDRRSPGARCRVKVGKELRELQWAYYVAIGDGSLDGGDSGGTMKVAPLVRLYWHLTAAGAVRFIDRLTTILNSSGVPFRAKVLSDPSMYARADSGVLYLNRCDYQAVRGLLGEVYVALSDQLCSEVPLFTRRLARGLGLAEDPDGKESFGWHRCDLIAEALWQAWDVGYTSASERLTAVIEAFRSAGLDPARPHLQPGSEDSYLPIPSARKLKSARPRSAAPDLLSAAAAIGDDLCRRAWWHRGQCNWMGRAAEQADTRTAKALNAGLYSGSAGVAFFLAWLYAFTEERGYRRAALGAISRSLDQMVRESRLDRTFFSGRLGIVWAALQIGDLTRSPEVRRRAEGHVADLSDTSDESVGMGLLGGTAGTAVALLDLGRFIGSKNLIAAAAATGEKLYQVAESCRGVGLGYGPAGVALALFEVYAATGRDDLRRAAVLAMSRAEDHEPSTGAGWCQGTAGVALAYLRGLEIDPLLPSDWRQKAKIRIDAATRFLGRSLDVSRIDTTLSHGLAGIAEVLQIASAILGDTRLRLWAEEAAVSLLHRYLARNDWPSGTPCGGANPSLMLGQAGVGYWLLRLHEGRRVPSVLLPGWGRRQTISSRRLDELR